MRGLLEVLLDHRHPVGIVTKGSLIERDVDMLAELAAEGLVHVDISITTLDSGLARRMEPRAPAPNRRLDTIGRLVGAGIPVRAMVAPVIPGLTDHELEAILSAAQGRGAQAASMVMLRLPLEVAGLFHEWLENTMPDRAARVRARVRDVHGGRDYDPQWGRRVTGQGVHADLVRQRFRVAMKRLGLKSDLPALRTDLFRVPPRMGDQLTLF